MATTEKFSAKEAAIQLGTDARTLRKFIRSKSCEFEPVGQGNRYEFTAKEIKALKKSFIAWSTGSKPKTKKTNVDENGFSDEDYAEHQDIDLDTYDGTTAEIEEQDEIDRTTEEVDEDDDGDPVDLSDLDGPDDEELEEIDDIDLD